MFQFPTDAAPVSLETIPTIKKLGQVRSLVSNLACAYPSMFSFVGLHCSMSHLKQDDKTQNIINFYDNFTHSSKRDEVSKKMTNVILGFNKV